MFEHEDEARLFSVEENGEILITTIHNDGTSGDTLLLLMETVLELPYANEFYGDYLAQIYPSKIVFVNIKTLEVSIKTLDEPKRYLGYRFKNHFLFLTENTDDAFYTGIRIDDLTEHVIPRYFRNPLDNEWLYNRNYFTSSQNDLILYNLVSQSYDTIVENGGDIQLLEAPDKMYVSTSTEVFIYDWVNNVRTLLHTYGAADVRRIDIHKEELFIYEYLGTTATIIISNLDGQNVQMYELSGLPQLGSSDFEVLLKFGNDYLFQNGHFDLYQTDNMDEVFEIDFGSSAKIFPEASDSTLYYTNEDGLRLYDPQTGTDIVVETINDNPSGSFSSFSNFLKVDDQYYLEQNGRYYTNHAPSTGMERIEFRAQRPYGFDHRVAFVTTASELYVQDEKVIYHLQGEEFQKVPNVEIKNRKVVEFKEAIYFRGIVDGVDGFYKIQGAEEPVLVNSTAPSWSFEKSENGDFLFMLEQTSSGSTFSIFSDNQSSITDLDNTTGERFFAEGLSIGATIFLEGSSNDTTSLWALNLETNTLEHLFDCQWFGKGFALHNKYVVQIRDIDNLLKLAFIDRWTNEVEYFTPPTVNGAEYHMVAYLLNCAPESMLFSLSRNDCTSFEIWSTEGTVSSTQLLLEKTTIPENRLWDFSLHKNSGDLFFSIKVGDELYEHYSYNCETQTLDVDTYPDDLVICRRFNAGDAVFGISIKDPVNGRSVLDITDPDNTSYISPLGYFKNVQGTLGSGLPLNTSQPMAHGEDNRRLAVLSILPFGHELCYVYEDGTIEMLTDLNPGLADAFLNHSTFHFVDYKGIREIAHEEYLYFDAYTRDGGHQIYRLPKGNLTTNNNDVTMASTVISLYPNPATNNINVKLEKSMDYYWSIISLDGKTIQKGIGNLEEESFDVSGLGTGFYYFYMEIDGRRLAKGFLKK